MYKVIDGELYNVTKIDKQEMTVRVNNAVSRVENIDNQLRVLLAEKSKISDSLSDISEVLPELFPEHALKLGLLG